MNYLGVDPGLSGAIAVLDQAGSVLDLVPMPVVRASEGKGRDKYDLAGLRDLLERHHALAEGRLFVNLEKPQPLPPKMGGGITNFGRGYVLGVLEGMLGVLRVPYELASPREWQREMHQGTSGDDLKQRSILAAHRLFPAVSLKRTPLSRSADDGLAEALLIAEWGRRVHLGGLARGA